MIDHLSNFIKKHLKKFNNMNNKGQKIYFLAQIFLQMILS